jgi:precorrin-3B synthase
MPSRASALGRPAFIIDPDNPALGISTCVGMPDCAQGSVSTIVDSNWLAGSGAELGAGVHVSGCAKGCAHPGPAAITLVGAGGLYDLVRDGHAGDIPVARGLSITEMAALLAADPRK